MKNGVLYTAQYSQYSGHRCFHFLKKMQISIQMINVDEHYFNYFNFIIDDW